MILNGLQDIPILVLDVPEASQPVIFIIAYPVIYIALTSHAHQWSIGIGLHLGVGRVQPQFVDVASSRNSKRSLAGYSMFKIGPASDRLALPDGALRSWNGKAIAVLCPIGDDISSRATYPRYADITV